MAEETPSHLTSREEARLEAWLAACDDSTLGRDDGFFEDGVGGYDSANVIATKIRSGSAEGKEHMRMLMELPDKVFERKPAFPPSSI